MFRILNVAGSYAPGGEGQVHLRFFQSMDRVNRAIVGADDLEQMMSDVLDAVLAIFGCDRAWLAYPCDPDASSFRVPMERTRAEYPGAFARGHDMPVEDDIARAFREARAASGPVKFGDGTEHPVPAGPFTLYQVQSMLGMAIYPKGDSPYMFGIHQCSRPRQWTAEDVQLLQEIGRRLSDGLTSLLAVRRLRDSEARYRAVVDNATDALFVFDERGVIEDVNRQACEGLGYSREELIGASALLFNPDITEDSFSRGMKRIGEGHPLKMDTHHRRKDGTTFPVEVRARRMSGEGRWWAVTLVRDITERKRAEEALRDSEQRLRAFFETSNAGMGEVGPNNRIARVNEAFCRMVGYSTDELQGRRTAVLFFPEDLPALRAQLAEMRSGRADRFQAEHRFRRKDGGAVWTLIHVAVLSRDASGAPSASSVVVIDLTERKRLEEHLQIAQKMEAVGQLAGGVAHDFNNLLTVIGGYGDVLLARLSHAPQLQEHVRVIREATRQAARLTKQLLAFSRKAIVQPKVLDLNEAIESTGKMLSRLIGEDVALVTQLRQGLSPVYIDRGQVEQVIMNLAVNARDAMPRGGRLTIETDEIDLRDGSDELRPGTYVRLRVADTGCGMTEEVRGRIFEPFFTTKGTGRGTGLGLATVYGIVRQASGLVSVESQVGTGSVFTILLPAVSAPVAPVAADTRAPPRGTETILLVEDEDAVRKLAREVLQQAGYTVLEAARGAEALRIADTHEGSIDLLLTDVVMPGLGGRDLADAVRARRPPIKVLYMSGFTDDAVVRHGVSVAADALLQKPFSPLALTRKVRSVLDEKAPAAGDADRPAPVYHRPAR
jgi:PAS domain S-box-containing protein